MREEDEVELKLDLPEGARQEIEDCELLRSAKPDRQVAVLQSVYFDTPRAELKRAGISLRVRSDGQRYLQTIKASANPSRARHEWEWQVASAQPDLKAAKQTNLTAFSSKKLRQKLRPIFTTRVQRTVYPLARGNNLIELAFDEGDVESAQGARPIREMEVELKRGEPSQLFKLARELSEHAPLRLVTRSKATRGYDLLAGRSDSAAVKAIDVTLDKKNTVETAFQAIASNCLAQVAENYPAVARGDPEGVHQMRVGLRRLRASISLFKAILNDRETGRIKRELKWLTDELGPARQLHVYTEGVVRKLGDLDDGRGASSAFKAFVRDQLAKTRLRASAAVESDRFRALLLDIAAWIDTGYWRSRTDVPAQRCRERRASRFGDRILAKRSRKVAKRGRKLRTLRPRERHKLRIAAKKLRYGTEFFANLLPAEKQRQRQKGLKKLKRLLDCLGALNDVSAHQTLGPSMLDGVRDDSSANVGFDAGRASAIEACRTEDLLRESVRVHRKFEAAKLARSIA